MKDPIAYHNADPAAVETFRKSKEANVAWSRALVDAAKELGDNGGPFGTVEWDGYTYVRGLVPAGDPERGGVRAPAGWRYLKTRDRLEPERGPAGMGAREWLRRWRQPADAAPRVVLALFGLPTHAFTDELVLIQPSIEELGGELWALASDVLPECTWERARLSDYYRAKESAELAGTKAPAVCPECRGSGVVDDPDNTGCYGCSQGGAHESWCGLAPCPRGCPIPVPVRES